MYAPELPKPWFEIIDVADLRGRSLGDIAAQVLKPLRIELVEFRGSRQTQKLVKARRDFIELATQERPDLSSQQIGTFMRRDPSCVRRYWRLGA